MALINEDHMCQLTMHSYSKLPILPPYSTWKQKLWRNLQKKLLLPSMNHPQSTLFFRSSAALTLERKRYIRLKKWYIIHPFSNILIIRRILQLIIWSIAWTYFPYYKTFISYHSDSSSAYYVYICFLCIYYISILMYFIIGFYNVDSKEIVISFKKIATKYMSTYCIVDCYSVFPFHLFNVGSGFIQNEVLMMLQVIGKLSRLPEYFICFRHITYRFKCNEMFHDKLCLLLASILIAHWCGCAVYVCYLKTNPNNSWFMLPKEDQLRRSAMFGFRAYRIVMSKIICIFLRSGMGLPTDLGSRAAMEQILLSMVMIVAFILHLYIIIVVLQLSRSSNASEYKYEEIVCQLKQFMRSRDLPFYLQNKILQYYEHRYQNHYFKEASIRAAISEHLYHEIFLNGCARLIETTNVLHGLSRFVIGEIIICLTPDVFLINDYITRANDPADYLYFISYGTAAMYLPDGEEISHLEDGDVAGLMQKDNVYLLDVIAIEITEVFRWNKKDYLQCAKRHESLAKKMENAKLQKEAFIKEHAYKKESDRYTGNVLYQLGKGRIVDKLIKRANILETL